MKKAKRMRVGGIWGALMAVSVVLAGCDITNPGRVLDEDLNSEGALRVVVDGLIGDVARAHRSIHRAATAQGGDLTGTASYRDIVEHWHGEPTETNASIYDWLRAAVDIGDRAVFRVEDVLGERAGTESITGEAYLWSGMANRLAGDMFCQAVIDGGPPEPRTVYHERAVERFSRAIEIADATDDPETSLAAHAGRAHSRMQLGDWSGALADAEMVPDDFRIDAEFGTASREESDLWFHSSRSPGLNVRWTWFQWYDENYDDRRITFDTHVADAADGSGTFYLQSKYTGFDADIALSRGSEMRLIEAEYYITQTDDWEVGLEIVNDVRTEAGMDPWTASDRDEAFEALKMERAIELWLEMRRLGDLWRWGDTAAGDPIISTMYELTPPPAEYEGGAGGLPVAQESRATCLPFSLTLKGSNPHID